MSFAASQPDGYASVSALSVTNPVVLGQDFTINVALKEVRGYSKTFEQVAVDVRKNDGTPVYNAALFDNVALAANATWSRSVTSKLFDTNPAGTYKILIRGKVGGEWFDFDTTGGGANPVSFATSQLGGYASLVGTVLDIVTLQPINGATILVGNSGPYATDGNGRYVANEVTPGTFTVTVSKSGYDNWVGNITLNPHQAALKNIKLTPAPVSELRVTSITSKYTHGTPYYFLPGVPFDVSFTAHVNWNGKTPKTVRFITSRGEYDVATSGATATMKIDVGSEFDPCATLQVMAIASDGSRSAYKTADFLVTKTLPVDPTMPLLTNNLAVEDSNATFKYINRSSLTKNLLDQAIEVAKFKGMPILKDGATFLTFIPEFDFEFAGDEGKVSYNLSLTKNSDFESLKVKYSRRTTEHSLKDLVESIEDLESQGKLDMRHFPKAGIAGFNFSLFPDVKVESRFSSSSCGTSSSGWESVTGYGGLAGAGEWSVIYQGFTPTLVPIPYYLKGALGLEFDAMLNINRLGKLEIAGDITTNPYITGTIGAGVNDLVGVEGAAKGGVDVDWSFPVAQGNEALTACTAHLSITGRAYLLVKEIQFPTQRWDTDCSGKSTAKSFTLVPTTTGTISLISRDYLTAAKSTSFFKMPKYVVKTLASEGLTYSVSSSPIISTTFPVSASNLSSFGSNINLLWLDDKPERSSINRTMLVHSTFDGVTWSTPTPIADNGTADFNPISITFGDGAIVAAWETMKTTLDDAATLEEMTPQLEIASAVYDPVTKSWGSVVRLTGNATLDRTPRLAGKSKSNLLLTWIGSAQNDISGSVNHPNNLYYAFFNGTSWSTPKIAAVIPNSIKRYNVVYDGNTANLVLALDTDGDPSTLVDLELYRLTYSSGAWGGLNRLTADTVIDDNPQLSLDSSNNVVMTWLKNNELSSVVNFDFINRTIIRTESNYTSALADFKQATTGDGKVAVIYADSSDNNTSDLFGVFYDPNFKLWGQPKQLTDDAETEQWPSIAFMGADTIICTFNRKLLINPDGTPTVGALSDLYMLKHTMGDDLALEPGSLSFNSANAAPGTTVILSVKTQNLGDKVVQNIPVNFYIGDPAAGGTLIDTAVIVNPLKPGDSLIVSVPWTIPNETAPQNWVYAVIDPSSIIDTLNRANNVTSTPLALPDLKLQSLKGEELGINRLTLVATVVNAGATRSPASTLTIHRDSPVGPVLTTIQVAEMARFESVDYAYEWDTSAVPKPWQMAVAIIDEAELIPESVENNNTATVAMSGSLADISVTPSTITFSNVAIGQTYVQILSITNTGSAPLTVSGIEISGPQAAEFSIATGGISPCASVTPTLGPWLSCTLAVSVTPVVPGPITNTLTIASNGATERLAIPLTANGTINEPINGACGNANGQDFSIAPTMYLCSIESAATVTGTGPWNWICYGTNGGAAANCSANKILRIDGTCGSSNNANLTSTPSSGLCSLGTATHVLGTGPWTWSCSGINGGALVSCTAKLSKFGDLDNDNCVTIAEVQKAINMFLGLNVSLEAIDTDRDGRATISDVQKIINNFLGI